MATVGLPLTAPEPGWARYNEDHSSFEYNGTWIIQELPDHYDGVIRYATTENSFVRFNFTGNKIRIISFTANAHSETVEYSLDGEILAVRNHKGSVRYQVLTFEKNDLEDKEHSFVMTVRGPGYMAFDAVDIDINGELKPYNPNPIAVSAPSSFIAEAGNSVVNLSWDTVAEATGYKIKRSEVAGGPYTVLDTVSINSFTDNAVVNGMTYYYVVTASIGASESANSNEVSASPMEPLVEGDGILRVTMIDSGEREYRLSNKELSRFVTWMDRPATTGTSFFVFDKVVTESKEYLLFDKIISFDVKELK